ncbi:MAG: threonine synthase, partial [Thermoprotei archaeon]
MLWASGVDVKAWFKCIGCNNTHPLEQDLLLCPVCGDLLEVEYDFNEIGATAIFDVSNQLYVWKYRRLLPISENSVIVSLNEGGTRLIRCVNIGRQLSLKELYVKNEGDNPTGSFKDRGMTVGVTRAVQGKAKSVICASTGNTAASMSAYAARAGLKAYVVVPESGVAKGKLLQSLVYGATVILVSENFDSALKRVLNSQGSGRAYLLNSVNPFRLEGQKTLAFEIYEQTHPTLPDKIFIPVGNGGNITALWKGFRELIELGLIERPPQIIGVQAEGASPIVRAYEVGLNQLQPVLNPTTYASAIRIGSPVRWKEALDAIRRSNGVALAVSDTQIRQAQQLLARLEGVFVEPASAASLAGLIKLYNKGEVKSDERVVCVL